MKRMLSVPIPVGDGQHMESLLEDLRRAGAERVYLIDVPRIASEEELDADMKRRAAYLRFFREAGLEVGFWMNALGFGIPLTEAQKRISSDFTPIKSIGGAELGDAFCPFSGGFTDHYLGVVRRLAALSPDIILLDDDFCLSVRPGVGCACDAHMAEFSRRMGREVPREELFGLLFGSSDKSARRCWMSLMGETLCDFARAVRSAIDEVDPTVRCGFCTGFTSWDFEGVDPMTLTRCLAGSTRPLLRTTGAPYWLARNRRGLYFKLQDIVEMTRMQGAWIADRDPEIELFDENDNYPRLSTSVPAAYCECFDLAMAVDQTAAPFKYLEQYISSPAFERSYQNAHLRNLPAVRALWDAAEGGEELGIWVPSEMRVASEYDFDPQAAGVAGGERGVQHTLFAAAHTFATRFGIPTVYRRPRDPKVAILCGENARSVATDELPSSLILDAPAAILLQSRGLDVGFTAMEPKPLGGAEFEYIEGDRVQLWRGGRHYLPTLRPSAEVLSEYADEAEGLRVPLCYRYENDSGQRFLVYCFAVDTLEFSDNLTCHPLRKVQLLRELQWLGVCESNELPFTVEGNFPGIYALCRRTKKGILVALFNFTPDGMFDLSLTLKNGLSLRDPLLGSASPSPSHNGALVHCLPPFSCVALLIG